MSRRITKEELDELTGRKPTAKSKYNAQKVKRHGWTIDSKAEAAYYDDLMLKQRAGVVSFFLWQVPIRLPGKTKMVMDFVVFYPDSRVEFVDVKGVRTQTYRMKKRQVEELYPIEVVEA